MCVNPRSLRLLKTATRALKQAASSARGSLQWGSHPTRQRGAALCRFGAACGRRRGQQRKERRAVVTAALKAARTSLVLAAAESDDPSPRTDCDGAFAARESESFLGMGPARKAAGQP